MKPLVAVVFILPGLLQIVPGSANGFSTVEREMPADPHFSITIASDRDFTRENGVVGGSGLPEDPYVIAGWVIVAPTPPDPRPWAIAIFNTTKNLVIRGNVLVSPLGFGAVYLNNVTNVIVEGNRILHSETGIYARASRNVEIRENRIEAENDELPFFGFNNFGIVAVYSPGVLIALNDVEGVFHAVELVRSPGSHVVENTIQDGISFGIVAVYSPRTRISGNFIGGGWGGIDLVSNHVVLDGNTIRAGGTGIAARDDFPPDGRSYNVTNVSVIRNRVEASYIALDMACLGCLLAYNDFIGAEYGGTISSGVNVTYNNFIDNDNPLFASGDVTFYRNNLEARENGLLWADKPVDARHNWWGSPDGPNPGDIQGSAPYTPWLVERVREAGSGLRSQ